MVIRKPYAFLIKHFRVIHAILFILLGYIALNTFNIYSFYSDYATNHYFVMQANLASSYIDYFVFLAMVLAVLVSLVIYYIMKVKNKERKFYVSVCLFYVILFVFYIILFNYFKNLEYKTMEFELVRVLRDLTLIVTIPQIIFTIISLGRALGFNIKQFDFKKDLEDLQIDASDYEEVEITLGKDNYKYLRFLRRQIRYLKYFIYENKFFVTILGSVFVLVTSLIIFVNLRVYTVEFSQNDKILASTLWYTAEDAYITNKDLSNNEIIKDKYYLLIRINVDNRNYDDALLDRNTFRLELNNKLYLPKFNLSNKFVDIGEVYTPTVLKSGDKKEYIIVYELDKKDVKNEYILKIKNADRVAIGQIDSAYKDVVIKPYSLDSKNDTGKYKIPNDLSFNGTTLYDTTLHISNYDIASSFKEYYKYCEKSRCYDGTYAIAPSTTGIGESSILKLSSTIDVDKSIYISTLMKYPADFYTYFATLSYRTEGVTKNIKLNALNSKYGLDKSAYFEVPKDIEKANKIEIIINIRGIKYTLTLK